MKVTLDKISLEVTKKLFGKVKIKFDEQVIHIDDSKTRVINIIKDNYERIKSHYISNLSKDSNVAIDYDELNIICASILFHYLEQYTRWKLQYTKSNYDINFYEKDFDHPSTHDIIIFHFKKKYPENFREISRKYIDMTVEEFDLYWENRIAYFNK